MEPIMKNIDRASLLAIGLAALYLTCCTNAQAVEQDKTQHFAISAAMAAAATAALEGRTAHPIIYGIASSFAVGIAKEAYDKAHPKNHTASGADLAADLLGATVGAWAGHGLYVQAGRGNVALGISKDF
jgi:uncharacterized protein YfiM (DUF2279 family)